VVLLQNSGGGGSKLATAIAEDVIPYVDAHFDTIDKRHGRVVAGVGWVAADALLFAMTYPDLMRYLALQSPYMLTAPKGGLGSWLKPATETRLEVYLDWGKYDLRNSLEAWSMAQDARQLFQRMQFVGYQPSGGEFNHGAGWVHWGSRCDQWLQAAFSSD